MNRRNLLIAAALVVLVAAGWHFLIKSKTEADGSDSNLTTAGVQLSAAVARAERHAIENTLTLSGEFKPFQEVDVHAKVAGYIKAIHVDVGDHVKAGQTLAVLEIPELAAQLAGADASVRRAKEEIAKAQGDLDRAQSAHSAAHAAYARLAQAARARAGLVAQQELDDAEAKDREAEAQADSAQAALSAAREQYGVAQASFKQVSALSDYTRIIAPFNGVVTKRYADTGALVQAGTASSTQAMPVVTVAETDVFRLTLPVPESAVPMVHLDSAVQVHVPALNRDFQGHVSRFADALDGQTRTMHTEVDVRNSDGSLVQGMYAEVALTLAHKDAALTVPTQAVLRNGSDATVLVVGAQNRLEERAVKLGLETKDQMEVVFGLKDNEMVVIGSRAQFHPGDQVIPKPVSMDRGGQF